MGLVTDRVTVSERKAVFVHIAGFIRVLKVADAVIRKHFSFSVPGHILSLRKV